MSPPVPTAALGALVLAAMTGLLCGCGLGAGPAPKAVSLLVTRDFGARTLRPSVTPKVAGQETVMSLLMRNDSVQTRYSGGFVESLDGLHGGHENGRPVDWFYYVNGVEASTGAAERTVHPGDHIWWDLHDWSQTENIPAVVGSFPEPFLNGLEGKRLPVRVECEAVGSYACRAVDTQLHEAGVPAAIAAPNSGPSSATLRVLVATFKKLRAEPAGAALTRGPRASGVYARFAPDGSSLALLDADGGTARTLAAGGGLIAATRGEGEAPVWLVTGVDEAGVDLAAHAFDAARLRGRFALAASGGQTFPLPVAGG